jgi:hypothetical protein
MPPMMFWLRMVFAAPSGLPVEICRMNKGMSIIVGHAFIHGAS